MQRWDTINHRDIENEKVDAFLLEVIEVCKKHGLTISHEDNHGAFEVAPFDPANIEWLMNAADCTQERTQKKDGPRYITLNLEGLP